YERFDTTVTFPSSILVPGNNAVTVQYAPLFGNPDITPNVYFDLIEIQYPKIFKFENNELSINFGGTDTTSSLFRISGFNSGQPVYIYDVNNNFKITNFTNSTNGDTLIFTAKNNANLYVVNHNITKKPFR